MGSVRQLAHDRGDQAHHQGQRDHEVRNGHKPDVMHVRPLTVCREDDTKWPQKNKDGRQELEIRLGNEHISFEVRELKSS